MGMRFATLLQPGFVRWAPCFTKRL